MIFFDTHCHLADAAFAADRRDVLQRARAAGVQYFLCPGTDVRTSAQAVALSQRCQQVYAAAGIHPQAAETARETDFQQLRHWLQTEKRVLAIGEAGLDYHEPQPPRDIQKLVFRKQVELAAELDVPLIIHDREAHGDTLDILNRYGRGVRGVFHCYSGSLEMAQQLVRKGFYIGFDGPLVYPRSRKLKRIASALPAECILIETDAPCLPPPLHRGSRNEPAYVAEVAAEIARLRGWTLEETGRLTAENGKRLFGINEL